MIAKVSFKIDAVTYQFEADDKDEMESISKAIALGDYPRVCNVCNGDVVRLITNKDKEGNIYVNVACDCGAKAKLGRYKTGGYFWHDFELYQKTTNRKEQNED